MTCDEVRDLAAGFVLGALEPDEEQAVRDHLATCPEPHDEFAALGSVVPILAEGAKVVEPPPQLRGRILDAAARDLAERQATAAPAAVSAVPPSSVAPGPVAPIAPAAPVAATVTPVAAAGQVPPTDLDGARAERTSRVTAVGWILGLAAVLAIVALGAWNLSLRSDLDTARANQQHVEEVLADAAKPGATSVILTSPDTPGRGGLAVVSRAGDMSIVVRGFEPTRGGTVYEAWVIRPKTAPTPVGSFTVGADGTGYLPNGTVPAKPGPMSVALTLEPGPGATTPTLPIISSGAPGA